MLALTLFAAAGAASAEAASFVYVTVPAPACAAGAPCNPPQLIVIDADTGGIVKRLALPPNTQTWGMTISRDNSRVYVSNRDANFTGVAAPTSVTVVDARRHAILTTFSTNGLHTIAWVVRDSAGNAQGIGSRYFWVFNDR